MTTTPDGPPASAPTTSADPDGVEALLEDAASIVDDVAEREFEPQDLAAMDALDQPRRMVLVHAHPDDETIGNGATMARYALAGAGVTLVTCTRGERGEVVEPTLAHLEGDRPALAAHRVMELGTAMEALGVEDHRFLDDAPLEGEDAATTAHARYEDSGMAWVEVPGGRTAGPAPDTDASAFALADVEQAASRLAGVLREVRPQVLITYEAGGGYGHPDHVQAARVALRAVALAADTGAPLVAGTEPWTVAKVYESVVPASQLAAMGWDGPPPSMVVPDEEISAVVDAPEQLAAKVAALRAHRSQVQVRHGDDGWELNVSDEVWVPVSTSEAYRLARGPASTLGARETDLFTGLAL